MSQFSELMGSFIRNGNYPLEADYIFSSEKALKDFYANDLNKTRLHEGLFKIVASENEQILYWVTKDNDEYVFVPLIKSNSIEELQEKLNRHIEWYEG